MHFILYFTFLFIFHSLRNRHLEVMGARRNESFLNSQNRLCVWGEGDSLLSVSLSSHQKKNANHCIQRVPNLGNKRRYMHKKPHQESGLCNISYARYSEKRITQIYKALYGGAMLVSLWGAQIWLPGNQQKHLFLSFATNAWIYRFRKSERLK